MQLIKKPLSLILVALVFIMLFSCKSQKTEWNGTIEEEDGITVVKNPKKPMYGENILILEEELSIGEFEGKEELMFQQIRYIAVDEQENIYILDRNAGDIKVFDKMGKYLRTIGRKGQGPGEFILPGQVFIQDKKELLVYDDGDRSFSYFTLDGDFIKSKNVSKAEALEAKINSKGDFTFATMGYSKETGNITYRLDLFDKEVDFIKRLSSIPGTTDHRGRNLFPPLFSWAIDNNDNIVYGYQKEFELQIFNPEGKSVKRILKEHVPVKITEEEINERKKDISFAAKLYIPEFHPAFRAISTDEEGQIFVMTWEKTEGKNGFYHDTFDSKGRYIAKVAIKGIPRLWKNHKLYTIEEDEEGYQYIKRYKVTWKY
jgi:hypothetical protein